MYVRSSLMQPNNAKDENCPQNEEMAAISSLMAVINCSRTKFEAITVIVLVFLIQYFYFTVLTFRVNFAPLTFFVCELKSR